MPRITHLTQMVVPQRYPEISLFFLFSTQNARFRPDLPGSLRFRAARHHKRGRLPALLEVPTMSGIRLFNSASGFSTQKCHLAGSQPFSEGDWLFQEPTWGYRRESHNTHVLECSYQPFALSIPTPSIPTLSIPMLRIPTLRHEVYTESKVAAPVLSTNS